MREVNRSDFIELLELGGVDLDDPDYDELSVRFDYSGCGTYGRECPAIVCS